MKSKKILLTTILTIIFLGMLSTLSNAVVLQGTTKNTSGTAINARTATPTDWVINIRKMESKDGGMGLNETINEENALSSSGSNGIDVHLQKNTEYGAAILLGASDYGKVGTVGKSGKDSNTWMHSGAQTLTGTDIKASSTGNVTGIYELGGWDNNVWTAGGGIEFLANIDKRYRDIYETEEGKPGDATVENGITFGNTWHASGSASFATDSTGLVRGYCHSGVFSYYRFNVGDYFVTRACVVSAPGI